MVKSGAVPASCSQRPDYHITHGLLPGNVLSSAVRESRNMDKSDNHFLHRGPAFIAEHGRNP